MHLKPEEPDFSMARYEVRLREMDVSGPVVAGLWLARRNEQVTEGQPLLEILAGAAVVDLPSPIDGRLIVRCVEEDDPLETGQVLAVIESVE